MDFFERLGKIPALIPVVAVIVVLIALAAWKLIREFFPW